jgi:hypothetical protein
VPLRPRNGPGGAKKRGFGPSGGKLSHDGPRGEAVIRRLDACHRLAPICPNRCNTSLRACPLRSEPVLRDSQRDKPHGAISGSMPLANPILGDSAPKPPAFSALDQWHGSEENAWRHVLRLGTELSIVSQGFHKSGSTVTYRLTAKAILYLQAPVKLLIV